MKGLSCVLVASVMLVSCGGTQPESETQSTGPTYQSYASLAQMMQAIPFPASNIIFDAGNEDPEEALKQAAENKGSTSSARQSYGSVYGGWTEVENAGLALAETANLLLVPGRMCRNGRPAPVDNDDWRMYAQQLAEAGMAAYKAAQTKNLDEMLIVGGTVTDACAACHQVYRDFDDEADRCPAMPAAQAADPAAESGN